MKRRLALLVGLILLGIAVTPIRAASDPSITGTISGVELCPQSICGEAVFSGSFAGRVDHRPTSGVFWVGVTHDDLPTTVNGQAAITGGTWMIRTRTNVFAGTIASNGGTITYNGGNTFTISLTMDLATGGSGTLSFTGLLDHNPFPPTIVGTISQ